MGMLMAAVRVCMLSSALQTQRPQTLPQAQLQCPGSRAVSASIYISCLTVAALGVFALGPCLCVKHGVWGCLQELCKGIWHSGSTLCWLRMCHRKDESQA